MSGPTLRAAAAGRLLHAAVFVSVLGVCLASAYGEVVRAGLREVVPAEAPYDVAPVQELTLADQRIAVWSVARTAHALVSSGATLHATEACFPTPDRFVASPALVTLGALGVPAWLATRDPIATYNLVLVLLTSLLFAAAYWLVLDWSGSRTGALVAAVLVAFGPVVIGERVFPWKYDVGWTLVAMGLARRFFVRPEPWKAAALAAVVAAQLLSNPYAALIGAGLGVPFLGWLLLRHGPAPLASRSLWLAGGAAVALVAWGLHPYLGPGTALLQEGHAPIHLPWASFGPGSVSARAIGPELAVDSYFPGWLALGLGGLGLLAPARWWRAPELAAEDRSDPRLALVVGAVGLVLLATGGNAGDRLVAAAAGDPPPPAWPDPYAALTAVLPPLQALRGARALAVAPSLVLGLLAGLGATALVRRVPRRGRPVAGGLVLAVVVLAVARPAPLGLGPARPEHLFAARPDPERLAFYEQLDVPGPLLELPLRGPLDARGNSEAALRSAYHHRPIAACYGKLLGEESRRTLELARRVGDPAAHHGLYELGFRVLIRSPEARGVPASRLRAAAGPGGSLRAGPADGVRTAFFLRPPPGARSEAPGAARPAAAGAANPPESDGDPPRAPGLGQRPVGGRRAPGPGPPINRALRSGSLLAYPG